MRRKSLGVLWRLAGMQEAMNQGRDPREMLVGLDGEFVSCAILQRGGDSIAQIEGRLDYSARDGTFNIRGSGLNEIVQPEKNTKIAWFVDELMGTIEVITKNLQYLIDRRRK